MYKKKRGQDYYTNRHSCFLLQYHLVLVTKYRKPVLKGEVKELVYQIIRDILSCMRQIRSLPPGRLLMWSRPRPAGLQGRNMGILF